MPKENLIFTAGNMPPFDKMTPEILSEAAEIALERAEQAYAALKADTSAPTFENTVVALDKVFKDVGKIQEYIGVLNLVVRSDALSAVEESVNQKASEFSSKVYQDPAVAQRFQSIAEPTDAQDKNLYRAHRLSFESEGAFLDADGQNRIKAIDQRLISLAAKFNENTSKGAEQQAVLFTDEADLAGLSDSTRASLRKAAQDAGHDKGWLVVPERLQVDAFLATAQSRHFRETVFKALNAIGTEEPYDNEPVLKEMQALRHERSTMIGYPNYAEYSIARKMPKDLAEVEAMLEKVGEGAMEKFEDTVKRVSVFARQNGGPDKLEPWDLPFWAAQYQQKAFGFDAQKFSEYLPLENCLQGFFQTAEKIFGVKFQENSTHPNYHDDVKSYDVVDAQTGELFGVLYADMFARKGKYGGAWMTNPQGKEEGKTNVVTLNMNLMKPEGDQPSLVSLDDLETLFHEGGHALHGLLGTRPRHQSMQGTAASADYVEFFSMLLENWPRQRECLDSFARHHKTGEKIPDELFEAKEKAGSFMAERGTLLLVQNSLRDFKFHSMDPKDYTDTKAVEQTADLDHPAADLIRSYPLDRWSHLFSDGLGGYSAGYFSYLWSQGLSDVGFQHFKDKGLYDPETCATLKECYQRGGGWDSGESFAEFNGKPATANGLADAILEAAGIQQSQARGKAASAGGKSR